MILTHDIKTMQKYTGKRIGLIPEGLQDIDIGTGIIHSTKTECL